MSLCRYSLRRGYLPADVPEGWPTETGEVLVEVICEHVGGKIPAVIQALSVPGDGYNVHWTPYEPTPIKRVSEATKASIRRKSLERRVRAKAPMFADSIIRETIAANLDYFAGKDVANV